MSYADVLFKEMCEDIINNGTITKGEQVRPVWQDTGEKAHTIKKFGVINKYDLRQEFPAITFRKTAIKSAMNEILWIFQKKSNNIKDLNTHIWDEWADDSGSIGKSYGYQIGKLSLHHTVNLDKEMGNRQYKVKMMDLGNNYPSFKQNLKYENSNDSVLMDVYLDQMDALLYDLQHTPFSRRIMTSIWNVHDLHKMNLQPCCWNCTFNVTYEGGDKLVLNMILNQRSSDILVGNNWNVVQYALLLMMIAQVCNMEAGQLIHVIADAHIYDRHINTIKELITRHQYPAPTITLNSDIKNFYDFTADDITINNYITGSQVKNIPVAV